MKLYVCDKLKGLIDNNNIEFEKNVVDFIRFNFKKYSEMSIQDVWSDIQKNIDAEISKLPSPKISCKIGCSACCYIPVGLLDIEARYYADKINSGEFEIDKDVFNEHLKLDEAGDVRAKPCIFLKDGKCSIYDERPISCRKHMVVSDPEKCDYAKYGEGDVLNRVNIFSECVWSIIATYEAGKNKFGNCKSLVQDISKYLI